MYEFGEEDSTKRRCQEWLSGARRPGQITPRKAVSECEICDLEGHFSGDCDLLRLYLMSGKKANMAVTTEEKCRA